jgi:transposase
MSDIRQSASRDLGTRSDEMRTPDEVAAMLRLKKLGWGVRRIAREFGCSHMTVRRYLAAGEWRGYRRRRRSKQLDGLEGWIAERFRRHAGNADVVRQELAAERGVRVSLRTVERAVKELRRQLRAEAVATTRFETAPGEQMQIDFGERRVAIAGQSPRTYFFVATLGYSRRVHVRAFRSESQESWFEGLESAFCAFGGLTEEVLLDNARALVVHHDAGTREVQFNAKLLAFAKHWGFRPRACAPYRARTKGKDERGVGYIKRNAIAGREFASFAELEGHLVAWTREIADVRYHGTTGEPPMERFVRDEQRTLHPIEGIPSFGVLRELVRSVQSDCAVEVDTNAYSVPWRLIGERVRVEIAAGQLQVRHAGELVAEHAISHGRHERIVDPRHFAGVAGFSGPVRRPAEEPASALLRPLAEYEAVAGGSW